MDVAACFPVDGSTDGEIDTDIIDPLQACDPCGGAKASSSWNAQGARPTSPSRAAGATWDEPQRDDLAAKVEELAAKLVDEDRRLRLLEAEDAAAQARREARYWEVWLNVKIERVASQVQAAAEHQRHDIGAELRTQLGCCSHKVELLRESMIHIKIDSGSVAGVLDRLEGIDECVEECSLLSTGRAGRRTSSASGSRSWTTAPSAGARAMRKSWSATTMARKCFARLWALSRLVSCVLS